MPVQIGEDENFRDRFHFLASNQNPNDFLSGDATSQDKRDNIFNLHPGKELLWNTPMIEFEHGVVYIDGRLDLCKMVVGPRHITALMESLLSNSFIMHFILGNNIVSATGTSAVAAFNRKRPDQMETWYLAGNHIKAKGFEHLVSAVVDSFGITNLWLKRNPLGPGSVEDLVKLILETKNLRTLDLENTELGDAGVAELFTKLTGKVFALKNVFLNAKGIGEKGAKAIADALEAG